MEKLIELLNGYAHTYADRYDDTGKEIETKFLGHYDQCFHYIVEDEELTKTLVDDVVISKRYGFIKWLVENEKVNPYDPSYNVPTHIALGVDDGDGDFMVYERFFKEEELLMLLSIQDEPIKFLISILK